MALPQLHVGVLGPLRVECDGRAVQLGPRLVGLLSLLVMEAGQPVPSTRIIEFLWGPSASEAAPTTLRSHVSHLRRKLGLTGDGTCDDLVAVGSGIGAGYQLVLLPEQLDAGRFQTALADSRRLLRLGDSEETRRAVAKLREALALWRGPAFADVADHGFAATEIARLEVLRRSALHAYAEGLNALGRYAESVEALVRPVDDDPYDEGLRRLLALALYAEHRVDEAAEVCRQGLMMLHDRGHEAHALNELHTGILRRDFPTATTATVPHLLPPDTPRFIGRGYELTWACHLLSEPTDRPRILVVNGPAGVGKTTLAIRVGHSVADHFPDGQLYVNLRGFDPTGSATSLPEAVRELLSALRVPPQQIPDGLDSQVALYRSLLANRKMLVMLDNARDTDQVRPLLPGSLGCSVVVSSRNQLTGLVVAVGAHLLRLELLSTSEARQMLERRLGQERVAAEPGAVDEIISLCARLPLALAVVAARGVTHPTFTLAALAEELRDRWDRLNALTGGEESINVRAVFSSSYYALWPTAARLFRLLSLHPGPDISTRAAAALANEDTARVRSLLGELVRSQLVNEHSPGRYTFHDLLRVYSTELVNAEEPESERWAATYRTLDYYLHSAYNGARLLNPHPRDPITPGPIRNGVHPEDFRDRPQAAEWFTTEYPTLVAATRLAAGPLFQTAHAWHLTWCMVDFLDRQGRWHDWADLQQAALDVSRRLGDRVEQARAHRQLAMVFARLGRYTDSSGELVHARSLFREVEDANGLAHVEHSFAWLLAQQGKHEDGLRHALRAVDLFRVTGSLVGQARGLNALGWCHSLLGHHQQAIQHCDQAVRVLRDIGDSVGEAATQDSLGHAHHQLRDYQQARECYREAINLYQELGDRYGEASTLVRLGDTYQALGDHDVARHAWKRALEVFEELGHPKAAQVHDRVRRLNEFLPQ